MTRCTNVAASVLAPVVCFIFAACTLSAQPSPLPGVSTNAHAAARPAPADLYVIPWWKPRILGYAGTGGKPVIQLRGPVSPQGLAIDDSGNVYVTDAYAQTVSVYAPGSSRPFEMIPEPSGDRPYRVAVTSSNYVWTGNVESGGSGRLAEFAPDGTLAQTLSCSGIKDYSGALAVDAAGDLFVQSGSSQKRYVVEEVVVGQHTCTRLPPKFSDPGGIAVTNSGDLVVGDRQNYDAFTYAAPDFAKIVARTNLGGGNPHGASFSIDLSLTKANDGIWTADYCGPQQYGITLYRYPHGSSRRLAHIRTAYGCAIAVAADY